MRFAQTVLTIKVSIYMSLSSPFYRLIPQKYHAKLIQFLKFGLVGFTGLMIDTCVVYLLRNITGLNVATLIAYFVAATSNWFINRLWTFHGLGEQQHILSQWLRFLITNSLGFLLNRGTVFFLFFISINCRTYPVIALLAGAIAGMFANFNLSRKLVYTNRFSKKD